MSGIPAGAGSLLGKRLGKYEILALLALGGTAEIYLARIGGAAGFEKYVVVKCLHDHLADDQEFVKMFLDEARLAAHLDHSNIVQTMELGEHENRYYMVMEFLAGLSLAMIVRRVAERIVGGRLPVPLTLNIMAQACAGLHYAHERVVNGKSLNIVHRDISPQNLVVSFEGVVKVVDFGIAKAELRETKTRSGTIKGKFAYMSPEQCVATNVDRRTDVFALGVITWELLTGRRLFKKNSPYETYQAVIECNVEPPSKLNHELDPALDAIVMKAIAKDKDDRYPSAEAFGDALLGYLHHRGKGSGPGEVGRFFDAEFEQEIEEHGARMRELISGQDEVSVDTGASWGEEDEAKGDADAGMTRDLSAKKGVEESISLSAADLVAMERPVERHSVGGLSDVIGSLDNEAPAGDDDIPADRTRIEANPLERLKELNAVTPAPARAPTGLPQPIPRITATPAKGTPRAPSQSGAPPTLALQPHRAPTATAGPVARTSAASPTQPPQNVLPPQANKMPPSGPLPLPMPPSGPLNIGTAPPNMATQMVQVDPSLPVEPPRPSGGFPNFSHLPTMIADPEIPADQAGTKLEQQAYPDHPPPPMPTGYPVMNAQMSNAMQRSGDVYPSGGYQQPLPDSGQMLQLASPVGPQYGQQVDWAQAAATPARALPRWQLIAMFVGAILGALLVTVIIAKIAG